MKFLILCLFFIGSSDSFFNVENKFEFGQNRGRIAFTNSGSIGLLEKIKRIPVVVPECSRIQYVRVDVVNTLGPPAVDFDWDLSTVIITYRPLQHSISRYTVIAKTLPNPECLKNNKDELVPIEFYASIN